MSFLTGHGVIGTVKNCVFFHLLPPAPVVENPLLRLPKISRLHMGDYLCVASNGIAPSTSKKFRIRVQCEWDARDTIFFF